MKSYKRCIPDRGNCKWKFQDVGKNWCVWTERQANVATY